MLHLYFFMQDHSYERMQDQHKHDLIVVNDLSTQDTLLVNSWSWRYHCRNKIFPLVWEWDETYVKDNNYALDVDPLLEFVFTTKDVAGVGVNATLLFFNNEIGFQKRNIDSLCSVGWSTKKHKAEGG